MSSDGNKVDHIELEIITKSNKDVDRFVHNLELIALVITQDGSLAAAVKSGLEQLDCTVLVTDSIQRALRSYVRLKPDLVIVDEKMYLERDLNGLHLLKTMAEDRIPKVLLTCENGFYEEWDAVFESSLVNTSWKNECLQLLKRGNNVRQAIPDQLLNTDVLMKHWQTDNSKTWNEAVLVFIDMTDIHEIDQDHSYRAGERSILRLFRKIEESFPQGAVFRRKKGGFFLILQSKSAQKTRWEVEQIIFSWKDCKLRAKVVEVNSQDNLSAIMHKLLVGNVTTISNESKERKDIFFGIVDDDAIVRKMLEDQFMNIPNAHVKTFREGESFFQDPWHKQDGHFILIVDGNMPRIDGFEIVYRIRKEYDSKKYSIIMLTGRKSEQDIVRALELGADDYITKPFKMGELHARVKRIIKRLEQ